MHFNAKERYVFLALGVGVTGASAWWLLRNVRLKRTALRAPGVVVANVKSAGRYGSESAPQFQYRTPDGREWTVESLVSTRPSVFRVGELVTVLYRPEAPGDACLDAFSQLWLGPGLGLGVGLAFLVLAWFEFR